MQKLSYNVKEAVSITGIPRTKLYNFISSGELKTIKAGRTTLIRATDLQGLIDNLPINTTPRGCKVAS